MKKIRRCFRAGAVLLVLALLTPGSSNAGSFKRKKTRFLSIAFVNNTIGGDFNGATFIQSPDGFILAPSLGSGSGFSLSGGVMNLSLPNEAGTLGGELGLQRTVHRWVFQDGEDESAYFALNGDFRLQFFNDIPVQPFILAGANFVFLQLKNAAESNQYVISGATYSSLGLNLGVGVCGYLASDISLVGKFVFQPNLVLRSYAFSESYELDPAMGFTNSSLQFGTEYYF